MLAPRLLGPLIRVKPAGRPVPARLVDSGQRSNAPRADDVGMGAYREWLRGFARACVAAALLVLWHGQVNAACEGDIVESLVLEMSAPARERSAPCCAARVPTVLAADKLHAGATPLPGAALSGWAYLDGRIAGTFHEPRLPDRPWRPYCARSARLLR
jgi:hypothetical protein